MPKKLLLLVASTLLIAQSTTFRYERPLQPAAPGANRIAPDVTLLSGAAFADMRDLRMFDAAGKEVPYLLIPPDGAEPRWTAGAILRVAPTKTTSGFETDLGAMQRIDRLEVNGLPTPFLKRLRLEASGDRNHWTLLQDEGTLFDLPEENLRLTEIAFSAGDYRYLRVTWDDRESGVQPLPRSVRARLVPAKAAPAPLRAGVEFRRLAAGPGRSRFQVRLPGPHLPLAALELSVKEGRLLRTARVTEGRLSGGEVIPQTLGAATLRRVVQGNLAASCLRIPIRVPEGREIEILVDDGSNPPLNLDAVTMEFAPLPWIYFESASNAPVTARYGNPRLEPPNYDLEAMRKYIAKTDLKDANWGSSKDSQPSDDAANLGISPAVGAPVDAKSFRYSRAIPPSPAGLTALLIDAAVLAHSRPDLSDLRVADASDHQIPYLLERSEDVLSIDLPQLVKESEPSTKKTQSQYRLQLPYAHMPPAKLILTTSERLFQRTITVQVTRTPSERQRRRESLEETIADASWRHSDPETAAPPLTLAIPSLSETTLTIIVDEGDNRPLAFTASRVELPRYRLRFFYPANSKLNLLYGQDTLSAPRYDLELLAPRLVGVSSRELALASENAAPVTPDKTPKQTTIFWGALIAAVAVLLLLLVRLLRSETPAS